MTEPISAVLFDKDGTLVDTFDAWIAVNHWLFKDLKQRYGGRGTRDELDRRLGIEGQGVVAGGLVASGTEEQVFRAHHEFLGSSAPDWINFLQDVQDRSQRFLLQEPPTVHPIGKVRETLRRLRSKGYRLGVATSDSLVNARRDLADFGAEWIEFWATSDQLDHPKPHPESVLAFARHINLEPSAIAFVGDSLVDLQAARSAGAGLFIAIRSPTCPEEVLSQADAVLESIDEILGVPGFRI